jgi:hypothetical protein
MQAEERLNLEQIRAFLEVAAEEHFNPYLNFHRPC